MKCLRNILQHTKILEASWNITSNKFGRTSQFNLTKHQIIQYDDQLNAKAKKYLASCPEKINIHSLFESYFRKITAFYAWIKGNIADPALSDYYQCKEYIEKEKRRQGMSCFLALMLQQKKLNIYNHLEKIFSSEEIQLIMTPATPEEKAAAAIKIYDEHSICDASIREQVYALFRQAELLPKE